MEEKEYDPFVDEETQLVLAKDSKNKLEEALKRTQRQNWSVKRTLEGVNPAKRLKGFQAWKFKQELRWRKLVLTYSEIQQRLELWGHWFKKIEGEFGSGVLSYFKFLKWLWFLNIYIFLLSMFLVVIPDRSLRHELINAKVDNISLAVINTSRHCSDLYQVRKANHFVHKLMHFVQGSGFMEKTPMFYGSYSPGRLAMGSSYDYNLPLAYFFTILYFLISLALMCHETKSTLMERIYQGQLSSSMLGYANIVFGGWDFTLVDEASSDMRKKALCNELRSAMEEDRHLDRMRGRTLWDRLQLYLIRFAINLGVIGILALGGFLIYIATTKATMTKHSPGYESKGMVMHMFIEFIPSLTITVLTAGIPILFKAIVKIEDYDRDLEIRLTLGRTVFVKLASIAVLMGSLYHQLTCMPRDECHVSHAKNCVPHRCWETLIGQQMYRLLIVSMVAKMGVILFVEFPRKFVVTMFPCKLTKLVGLKEFDIPKEVIDLVYNQTLCWIGTFFAPLTPAMLVIFNFLFFYLMLANVLVNYVPEQRPYRASKARVFFMIILMTAFFLCILPIGYCIWKLHPSDGCGPFRYYDRMYEILGVEVARWPGKVRAFLHAVTSAGSVLTVLLVLSLVIFYYHTVATVRREMIVLLREQVAIESREKEIVLNELTKAGKKPPSGRQSPRGAASSSPKSKYQSLDSVKPLGENFD